MKIVKLCAVLLIAVLFLLTMYVLSVSLSGPVVFSGGALL